MSGARESLEARRTRLVARADAERQAMAARLAPLGALDRGIERVRALGPALPAIAVGAGLGLTALLLVRPTSRSRALRTGLAMFHLAGSVKRLLARA